MDKIYHYTSKLRWAGIKYTKELFPRSDPFFLAFEEFSDSVFDIATAGIYLVGVADSDALEWEQCGEKDRLIEYCTDEVILEIPILGNGFVRDVYHVSPNGLIESYGTDLRQILFEDGDLSESEQVNCDLAWQRYWESTMHIKDYQGGYKALEIWLDQVTHLKNIKQIK